LKSRRLFLSANHTNIISKVFWISGQSINHKINYHAIVVLSYSVRCSTTALSPAWVRTSGVEWPSVMLENSIDKFSTVRNSFNEREMRQHKMTVV